MSSQGTEENTTSDFVRSAHPPTVRHRPWHGYFENLHIRKMLFTRRVSLLEEPQCSVTPVLRKDFGRRDHLPFSEAHGPLITQGQCYKGVTIRRVRLRLHAMRLLLHHHTLTSNLVVALRFVQRATRPSYIPRLFITYRLFFHYRLWF